MKLVVTIPALNEEKTIAQVVRGVPRDIPGVSETEVIVLNDGSTDRTAPEAVAAGALVITLKGGGGLGTVFRTGLERAMRRGADIIVNIDGDGQFNPADIRKLVQPLLDDRADFVTCSRFADPALRPTMPIAKYWGNHLVTGIINWICGGTDFTDVSCGFRGFTREAAYRLTLFGRYTYTQETFIDLFSKGVRMVEVPLKVRGVREHGKSRIASNLWKYATNSFPIIVRAMRDIQPQIFRRHRHVPVLVRRRYARLRGRVVHISYRGASIGIGGAQNFAVHLADLYRRRAADSGVSHGSTGVARRHAGPPSPHQ